MPKVLAKRAVSKTKKGANKAQDTSEVLYPKLEVRNKWGKDAIDAQLAKKLLGWETLKEYTDRTGSEEGFNQLLIDENGAKVACWANTDNRPFYESWCRSIAQDLLNRNWAGPTCFPSETINGESIVVGKHGKVVTGQHRLVALVLANQIWEGSNWWKDKWQTAPVLDTLLVLGVSECPEIVRTIDNTKPRDNSDVFYTSELFRNLQPVDRKECSRMLGKAVDMLWTRLGANTRAHNKYKTNAESCEFASRHPRLLECVSHIFNCNRDRVLSLMRLSPGLCTGLMYLMATSATDGDIYRNKENPSEEFVDFEYWDESVAFWDKLSTGKLEQITDALANLVDEEGGDGRVSEKVCVITKAWNYFRNNDPFTAEDLEPEVEEDDNGNKVLVDSADFGGLDLGAGKRRGASRDEVEDNIAAEKEERAKKLDDKIASLKANKQTEYSKLKKDWPDHLLLFKGAKGIICWEEDADTAGKVLRLEPKEQDGLPKLLFASASLDKAVAKLKKAGYQVALVTPGKGKAKVEEQ